MFYTYLLKFFFFSCSIFSVAFNKNPLLIMQIKSAEMSYPTNRLLTGEDK